MSDLAYFNFSINPAEESKWQPLFSYLESNNFCWGVQRRLEAFSEPAADIFEQLMEDNYQEIGVFEEWDIEDGACQIVCDMTDDNAEKFGEILTLCGATNLSVVVPE